MSSVSSASDSLEAVISSATLDLSWVTLSSISFAFHSSNVGAEEGTPERGPSRGGGRRAVSYTHLTLPTIYSV